MNEEVRESLERWHKTDGFHFEDMEFCYWDEHRLAAAFAAENPADDGEVVTEEWLLAVGFSRDGDHLAIHTSIAARPCNQHVQFYPRTRQWYVNGCRLENKTTRGDVRRLCRVLGVELKEVKT